MSVPSLSPSVCLVCLSIHLSVPASQMPSSSLLIPLTYIQMKATMHVIMSAKGAAHEAMTPSQRRENGGNEQVHTHMHTSRKTDVVVLLTDG